MSVRRAMGMTLGYWDSDALAYISAAEITDETQKEAVNTLTKSLKEYNIWSKMKAVYPLLGGTATKHKWNLKDPRDLDAAFRLVWGGSWIHNSSGAEPDGTTAYANSFLKQSVSLAVDSASTGVYYNENTSQILAREGAFAGIQNFFLAPFDNNGDMSFMIGSSATLSAVAVSGILGFKIVSRINSTTMNYYTGLDGQAGTKTMSSIAANTKNFYFGAMNDGSDTPIQFQDTRRAFMFLGDALTAGEIYNYWVAVTAFNTTLGRNV